MLFARKCDEKSVLENIPHGYHSDEFDEFEWYPGGKEMGQQILDDIKAIIDQK